MFGCIWVCNGVFPLTLPSTSLDFTTTYSALAAVLLYFSIFSKSSNFLTFLASSSLDLGFDWCYYRQWNFPFQLFSVKPCAHTQLLSEAKTAARAQYSSTCTLSSHLHKHPFHENSSHQRDHHPLWRLWWCQWTAVDPPKSPFFSMSY